MPISLKKSTSSINLKVRSTRQPSTIREMGDVDFGALDSNVDNYLVSYDKNTNRFVLMSSDQVVTESAADNDVPDSFVQALQPELNLGGTAASSIDGGSF